MATVDVFPAGGAAALIAAINSGAAGDIVQVHGPHTYNVGTTVLAPKANMQIVGDAATKGSLGEISAPVKIVGSGNNVFDVLQNGIQIRHLDISGSVVGAGDTSGQTGNGIRYHGAAGWTFSLKFCKIHSTPSCGIMGQTVGMLVEDCELTNNSTARRGGISGAAKITRDAIFRRCYVHHNQYYGLWSDCQQPLGWTIEDCRIEFNYGSGIFNEIVVGPSLFQNNIIRGNNTSNGTGRGGIVITSSRRVTLIGNTFGGNSQRDLWIREDERAGNATVGDKDYINELASCQQGWRLDEIDVTGNFFDTGAKVDYQWDEGAIVTVNPLVDQTLVNPNDTTAPQEGITFSGNQTTPAGAFELISLVDDFGDGVIGAQWSQTVTAGASLTEAGGELVSNPGDGTLVRDARLVSAATYNMTEKAVQVEVKQILAARSGAQVIFVLRDTAAGADARFTIRSEADAGTINLRLTGTGISATVIPYDAVNHRFLRFRLQGGTLYWETSPTGLVNSWTVRGSATDAALTADLTSIVVWLGTGVFATTTADPGDAIFDNLNVTATAPDLTLVSPLEPVRLAPGLPLVLEATATDAVDGDLSADIEWTSSNPEDGVAGVLGSGGILDLDTSLMTPGSRTISGNVQNSAGLAADPVVVSLTIGAGIGFDTARYAIYALGGRV